MATGVFLVTTYSIGLVAEVNAAPGRSKYTLNVRGVPTVGTVKAGSISFAPGMSVGLGGGTVDTKSDFLAAKVPTSEFQLWLDLLRSERPVSIRWEDGAPLDPGLPYLTRLVRLDLQTEGWEPVGEGPIDQS